MSRVIKKPPLSPVAYHVEGASIQADRTGGSGAEPSVQERLAEAEHRVQQAEAHARSLVEQAQAEKENILNKAHADAETIRRQAQAEGLEQGRQQGRQEIEAALQQKVESFCETIQTLLQSIHQEKDRLIRRSESQLIDLACVIAGRIVRKEIEQDDLAVVRIVQQAIDLATEKEKLTVRLNPADLEWVRQHTDQILESHDGLKEIHFEDDPRIERGGCMIETIAGNVDARLERQMEEIQRGLEESR